jgi:hypothetical protein
MMQIDISQRYIAAVGIILLDAVLAGCAADGVAERRKDEL